MLTLGLKEVDQTLVHVANSHQHVSACDISDRAPISHWLFKRPWVGPMPSHSERISCRRVFRRKSSPYLYSFQRLPFPTSRIFLAWPSVCLSSVYFPLWCRFQGLNAALSRHLFQNLRLLHPRRCRSGWKYCFRRICHLLRRRTFWRSLPLCRQTSNVRYTPRKIENFVAVNFA